MSGFFQIKIPSTSNTIVSVVTDIVKNIKGTNGTYSLFVSSPNSLSRRMGGTCRRSLFSPPYINAEIRREKNSHYKEITNFSYPPSLPSTLNHSLNWQSSF